ncbi:hypothetical protein ACH5RR_024921 [Cinchona calisaya]|uniref:Glycosyltransferase 61 catalytic domain-containing protein n=1 Tax=Cinchona calisaya TaxID=153742 RepID=A0ABD2YY54_9GENT
MYDPIFAKSFSKYEQKRFGFWAILICTIMAVSICMEFNVHFHPLSMIGNAMNLQLSINAAQDMLVTKQEDKGITPPLAKEVEPKPTNMLIIKDTAPSTPLATEAKKAAPTDIKDTNTSFSLGQTKSTTIEANEMVPTNTSIVEDIDTSPPAAHYQTKEVGTEEKVVKPILCNFLGPLSDYCDIKGDVRIEANSSTVFIVSPDQTKIPPGNNSWSIQPYARKGNGGAMTNVKKWTIKLVGDHEDNIPKCTVNHSIPSILFSTGGYSGNLYHDFSDSLVPIYSTSQQFKKEVNFLATDYAPWWISKYRRFFSKLSRHEIIAIDKEKEIHCHSSMVVGLKSYKEFIIDSSKFPDGLSMNNFRQFLRSTYSLERTKAIKLKKRDGQIKPRLMLISRSKTRLLRNEGEITRMARKLGYDVIVAEADVSTNLTTFSQLVNSCDVLMGVHGAGLTNLVFLPDNAVFIQIVPFGRIDTFARIDFGDPSNYMNIRYLEYKIKVTESSLIQQYPLDHAVIRDPISIHKQGWGVLRSTYLENQNVTIDLRRFRSTLVKAIKLLRQN